MAQRSPVFPLNSLSCVKKKCRSFDVQKIVAWRQTAYSSSAIYKAFFLSLFIGGGQRISFVIFSCIAESLPLSLFSRSFLYTCYFCIGKFENVCPVIFFFKLSYKCFSHSLSGFVFDFAEKAFLVWSSLAYQSLPAEFLLFPFFHSFFCFCLCSSYIPVLPIRSICLLASNNCFMLSYSFLSKELFVFCQLLYPVGRSRAFSFFFIWIALRMISCVFVQLCRDGNFSSEYWTGLEPKLT